jgi:serine/threonine protein kinase
MSPEALENRYLTFESDWWSYGVLLWEAYSFGQLPYIGESLNHDFLDGLKNGRKLKIPDNADENM